MQPVIGSITNEKVRTFYALYWPQHQVIRDFYARLREGQFDIRLVDRPARKADTPRESLAHILYVQLVFLNGARTGTLAYQSMGCDHYRELPAAQLLAELDRIDAELYAYLTATDFDAERRVHVEWGGEMNVVDMLFFLRDHDILHIGWNLALMDFVEMPRFDSLVQYWGP